jgi:alkylation response protein AidB-like acyl-CoA dehydrogenase
MGVMSVEVPESYGGSGGTFFHSVLAVESLSRVDPSVGVLVDVQNTLVINAGDALGQRRDQAESTCPSSRRT